MPNKRPIALSLFKGHVDFNSKDLLNTVALFNIDMRFAGQYSCRVVTDHNESENTAPMTVIVGNYTVLCALFPCLFHSDQVDRVQSTQP